MNRRRVLTVVAQACIAIAVVGWAAPARAHPGYPAVIDGVLGTPGLLEMSFKPLGCQICHTSSSGATALAPFGTLMVSTYGLSNDPINEDDNSLKTAMIGLQADDPEAITDLKKGVDPNGDSAVFATALPQPTHGCAVAAATRRPPYSGFPLALAATVILVARRRRIAHASR